MIMGSMQCRHCGNWHRSSDFCDCAGARDASVAPLRKAIEAAKSKAPTVDHKAFRDDLLAVMNKHAGALDASDMMALAAYTVGQIMAMQDARRWTPDLALEVISRNIEAGNAQAIADAHKWMGSA